jgi:hypothetical protein
MKHAATSRREVAVASRATSSVRLQRGCLKAQQGLRSVVASVRSIGWLRSARGFANGRAQNMSLSSASRLRSAAAVLFNPCRPGLHRRTEHSMSSLPNKWFEPPLESCALSLRVSGGAAQLHRWAQV